VRGFALASLIVSVMAIFSRTTIQLDAVTFMFIGVLGSLTGSALELIEKQVKSLEDKVASMESKIKQ
jgi:hypothetical protein